MALHYAAGDANGRHPKPKSAWKTEATGPGNIGRPLTLTPT